MKLPPHSNTFNIGDRIRGQNCDGQPFTGTINDRCGPWSVLVDGLFTPTSLIDEVLERAKPPEPVTGGVFD